MRRATIGSGAFLGALTSVGALAVLELGHVAWGLPFVPFDIFEVVVRALPGRIVTAGIEAMVTAIGALGIGPTSSVAKLAEQASAVAMFVLGSAMLGAIVAYAASRGRAAIAGLAAAGLWIATAAATSAARDELTLGGAVWIAVVGVGWGLGLAALVRARAALPAEPRAERRKFLLVTAGGIAVASTALLGVSRLVRRTTSAVGGGPRDIGETAGPAASPPREALASRIVPAAGTRPELTPNASFYRIDINLEPPRIDPERWRLVVDGLVDHRLALSLEELRRMPAVSQVATLECISNPVGGDLIGTTVWTGVRLVDVMRRAGMRDTVRAVHVRAADGFYESISYADLMDPRTLLVYAMNHAPLADIHGFPLRVFIPERHGMKQPKWIISIHASDRDGPGYWVDRGWSPTAIPHTTSVIDVVGEHIRGQDIVPVGGIAYAGARGIRSVQVQVDGGAWQEARLVAPPLSPLCWVLWRYDWPYARGRHTFRVRAIDGTASAQDTRETSPHPDGATGIHALTKDV